MSEPTYAAVKKIRNYKITAIETVLKMHKGTNMILEDDEIVRLDEKKFKGATEELAQADAVEEVKKIEGCDITNVKWSVRPFPG